MDVATQQQLLYEKKRKSKGVAYLLWLFFGFFGAHRIYLERTGSGIAQLILTLTGIGLLVTLPWWIADAFLIPGMAGRKNAEIADELRLGIFGDPVPARRIEHAPPRSLDPRVEEIRELGRSRFRKLRDRF